MRERSRQATIAGGRIVAGAAGLLASALVAACGGGGGLFAIGVDVGIDRQTIPGALPLPSCDTPSGDVLGPGAIADVSIRFSEEEELEGRDLLLVDSIVLDEVELRIVDEAAGDVDTWDFLDSIRVFADDPADADPPVLVAVLDPVPTGVRTLVIPGTGENVADIAQRDSFRASFDAEGRPPCDDVHFEGRATFSVTFF